MCFRLSLTKNRLKIEATNVESGLTADMPVKSEGEATVLVYGSIFVRSVVNLGGEKLTLSMDKKGGFLKISSETGSTAEIATLEEGEFPNIPRWTEDGSDANFKITGTKFCEGLKSVVGSCLKSNIKPEQGSVYIEVDKKNACFVATDGKRLSENKISYEGKEFEVSGFMIPRITVISLIKTFDIVNEVIEFYITEDALYLKSGNFEVFSRLTEGNYPDYKKIIPKESKTSLIILKNDILSYLKSSSVFLNKYNEVLLYSDKKNIYIESNNDFGKTKVNIDCVFEGDDFRVKINQGFLNEGLSFIESDSVEIVINGESSPIRINPVGKKSQLYILTTISF